MVNKTVIVSGASGNLGTAVVNFYLDRGDQVIGLVHRSGGQPRNVANYVECAVNLLDELAVEECVKQLLEKFGKIDIAVMTAGGFAWATFLIQASVSWSINIALISKQPTI